LLTAEDAKDAEDVLVAVIRKPRRSTADVSVFRFQENNPFSASSAVKTIR
jgi:hypothetical protein